MQIQSLSGAWKFHQAGKEKWLPASVPGVVHTDLLAAGQIPDPFVGDNEKKVMWVAETDWEYATSFDVTPALLDEEQVFLVADGLDTYATVTLNGTELGKTNNQHVQYRWDVKALLKPADNQLVIYFDSIVGTVTGKNQQREMVGVSQAIPGGPHARKAPCQFGWDWGPMLPPMGIWKEIRLEGYTTARFEDIHLRQKHEDGKVTVSAAIKLEQWTDRPTTVRMLVTAPDGKINVVENPVQNGTTELTMVIENPQLWFPNGYGKQPLYQVEFILQDAGKTADRRFYQLGLRTIELRREPDQWGESFTFVVNGVTIFAKGSDWIPADSFPTRVTDDFLARLLTAAAETHQNMLRVWGGGFYEDDRFYNLCDRLGILVWQDFLFACSQYPWDEAEYVENVRQEVIQNVRRLRHRASLALWCGNNEIEWGMESWGWKDHPQYPEVERMYDHFFHHQLPTWVAELDPDTVYWPSSPSSETPFKNVNSQERGDAHYWDVWHGRKPFTAYRSQYPRFMSEFGFQSLPPFETVKTYAQPQDWNMTSYIMEHHQRSASGNGLMIGQMTDTFRMPKDFENLVYLSMVLQAEGIRYGVEHWRRNMDRVSGTLYWQLNDTWPVASWASLDYFGRWKALHYAARRFYAPVMLSLKETGTDVEIHVTSDLQHPYAAEVKWQLVKVNGEVLQHGTQTFTVTAQSNCLVDSLHFDLTEEQCRDTIMVANLIHDGNIVGTNIATFVPSKHLDLSEPGLKIKPRLEDDTLVIEVTAVSLARFVELAIEGKDVVFSDNYFDLPAGQSVAITAPMPTGMTLDEVKAALKVRSLYNSFA